MPDIEGIDYSFSRPDPAYILSQGKTFVGRYLSDGPNPKNITQDEADRLIAAGETIVLFYESTAGRATEGLDAGVADAKTAYIEAALVGQPGDRPIYFAVDENVSGEQVAPYFVGVVGTISLARTGAYGSYEVIKYLFDHGLISWGMQTYAWSGENRDSRAQIYQYDNGEWGDSVDFDRAFVDDFGQWPGPNITEEEYMQPYEVNDMLPLTTNAPHPCGWQSYNRSIDTVAEATWVVLRMPHWLKNESLDAVVYITDDKGNVVWNEKQKINASLPEGVSYLFVRLPTGYQQAMVQVDYVDTPEKRLGLTPEIRRYRVA